MKYVYIDYIDLLEQNIDHAGRTRQYEKKGKFRFEKELSVLIIEEGTLVNGQERPCGAGWGAMFARPV